MFIPDPGSWFLPIPDPGSRIPEPKTASKERGEKIFVVIPFIVATNFTKLKIILFLKCWRKNLGTIFKESSLSSLKYGFRIRDPGYGKNLFRIPDPGVKEALIPDADPQHGREPDLSCNRGPDPSQFRPGWRKGEQWIMSRFFTVLYVFSWGLETFIWIQILTCINLKNALKKGRQVKLY